MRSLDRRTTISARLTDRLGFGCGRLRAGLEERNSRRLIDAALESGIRYFDTAPNYGDGASERVLGLGLRPVRREVAVCTKVGFARPQVSPVVAAARAVIRSAVKPIYRRLASAARPRRASGAPGAAAGVAAHPYGRFEVGELRRQVQSSLELLQTEYLDVLILHEPRPTDPTQDFAQALQELVASRTVLRVGVGTGAALETLPRFGEVAQALLTSDMLTGRDPRAVIAHGLFRNFDARRLEHAARESGLLDDVATLSPHLADDMGASALLLNCAILGTRFERVLWSTSSVTRLTRVLAGAEIVHGEILAAWSPEREAMLADTLLRYTYGVHAAR